MTSDSGSSSDSDYEFYIDANQKSELTSNEKWTCCVCLESNDYPFTITNCDHNIGQNCLARLMQSAGEKKCPFCRCIIEHISPNTILGDSIGLILTPIDQQTLNSNTQNLNQNNDEEIIRIMLRDLLDIQQLRQALESTSQTTPQNDTVINVPHSRGSCYHTNSHIKNLNSFALFITTVLFTVFYFSEYLLDHTSEFNTYMFLFLGYTILAVWLIISFRCGCCHNVR